MIQILSRNGSLRPEYTTLRFGRFLSLICKKCGTDNKDYFVYCKECSVLLIESAVEYARDQVDESAVLSFEKPQTSQTQRSHSTQSVFESRRPSTSSFKENARKQAEHADASASRASFEQNEQHTRESMYDTPPNYASEADIERLTFGGGYQQKTRDSGQPVNEYRTPYQKAEIPVYDAYELHQMTDGPYYDPKARHHALDPWELLDEPEKQSMLELPPRVDYSAMQRSGSYNAPRAQRQNAPPSPYAPQRADRTDRTDREMQNERSTNGRDNYGVSPRDFSQVERPSQSKPYGEPAARNRSEYTPSDPYMSGGQAAREVRESQYKHKPLPEVILNDDDDIEYEEELPLRSRSSRRESVPRRSRIEENTAQSERTYEREKNYDRNDSARIDSDRSDSNRIDSDRRDYNRNDSDGNDYDRYEKRSKIFTVLFWLVMAALICTIIWYGVSYLNEQYGSVGKAVSALIGSGKVEAAKRSPTAIEETEYSGKPAHTIVVSGKDGEQAYFKDLDKKFPINGGSAKLIVVDLNWIPEEPSADQDTITVTPQVSIIDKDGVEIPLESPSFTVKVPSVQLTLTEPALTNGTTVNKSELTVSGTVAAGSHTRIFINDDEITDTVDEQGAFSYQYTLPGHGDHTITVTAKLPRYKPVSIPISVSFPRKDVSITLNDVPARTEDNALTINGTVEAGATVRVEGNVEGEVLLNAEAGTFSFAAKLESYGRNSYTITATAEGVTTTKELLIIRTPNMEEYTSKATEMDYAALKKDPVKYKGKVYRFEGKVKSVIETSPTTILIFNVGTDKSEKLLKLEYFGTSEMKEGNSYRVFGGVLGKDDEEGLPFLSAHFVYKP